MLQADPARAPLIQRERLATTLAGNCCDVLTITAPCSDQQELKRRKGAVISGEQACRAGPPPLPLPFLRVSFSRQHARRLNHHM